MSEADWWVYENWRERSEGVLVHYGICPQCNHGKFINGKASNRNGRWYGPFPDSVEAMKFARGLCSIDTQICAQCLQYVRGDGGGEG